MNSNNHLSYLPTAISDLKPVLVLPWGAMIVVKPTMDLPPSLEEIDR